jgi:hypothetical protein
MVGTLLVIMIIAGFALHQYIKGGIVSGFVFLVAAIIGASVAFGYYEAAAAYVTDYSFIGAKAYPLAFFLLFILGFVLVREVSNNLLKPKISFGVKVDKACGAAIGALVGYLFSGAILIVVALTPYRTDWLYNRFEDNLSNPPQANTMLLNPDGFLSSLFGTLSQGSFEGSNSFAVVHADYIDQLFLNRHYVGSGVSPVAASGAASIAEHGVRAAPENLMEAPRQADQAPQPIEPQAGQTLMLVRVRINSGGLTSDEGGEETKLGLAQLRLVLKDKQDAGNLTSGSGKAVYPIGYLNPAGQLEKKSLDTLLDEKQLKADYIDFAFSISQNLTPVLMEFRQNIIEEIRQVSPAQQQPAGEPAAEQPKGPAAPAEVNEAPAPEAAPAEQPSN